MNVIDLPVEFITPEIRERDRWLSVAFAAAASADWSPEDRRMLLQDLLKKFADVSDSKPELGDPNFPAYAVKLLLKVLTDETGVMAEIGRRASKKVLAEAGLVFPDTL